MTGERLDEALLVGIQIFAACIAIDERSIRFYDDVRILSRRGLSFRLWPES